LNYLKFEDEEEKSQDINTDKDWVKLSQGGVTWYGYIKEQEFKIPQCELFCNVNGRDILLHDQSEEFKDDDRWFEGTIRERFVEPGVDNLAEMREWFEEYSAPFTTGIGFEQWLPDQKVLFPTYYVIKFKDFSTHNRWIQYAILKSLESKEKKSND
jgi:hypothetical protein